MLSICRVDVYEDHNQLATVADFNDAVIVAMALADRYKSPMIIVRGIKILKTVDPR